MAANLAASPCQPQRTGSRGAGRVETSGSYCYSARDIPALKHELWSLFRYKTIPFQLESALRNIYNYLQRFAVGLEEIVLDQALFDGEFIQEFNEAEYKLKAVSVSAV